MANYPFKINIQTKNGTQLSYYSSSFATSAATNVSASAIVDSINALPRAQYTQSEAVPNSGGFLSNYSTAGATGGKTYLSASHDGPQSGSITFTDTEDSATNGGLDFYTFWGTKVCSVLGLPEGIPIYTENFKFSDDENDTTNYISGDVIADGITVKEGFKLSTQARVRGNLIFDDVFGEGFVQFVSGSVTKMTVGYNDDKDFYKIGGSTNVQISGSSANIGVLSGVTTINSSTSPATTVFATNFRNGLDRIVQGTYDLNISANGAFDATTYTRGQISLSRNYGVNSKQNIIIGNNHIRYSVDEVWSGAVDTGLTHEDFPLYIHNATTAAVNTFAGIAFNIGGDFSNSTDGPRMMGGISIHRLNATEANRTANMIFSLNSGTTAGSGGSDADHGLSARMTLSHDGNLDVNNNITVGGTVDGIDIAGSLDQAVKTTSSPTFAAVTITGDIDLNGDLVGDDATDITNIESIYADHLRSDADGANNYINLDDNDFSFVINGNEVASFEDNTINLNDGGNNVDVRMEAQSGAGGAVDKAKLFNLDASLGVICIGNTAQDTTASTLLQVTGNATNDIVRIFNDGNNENRSGMQIRCGTDNGTGTNEYIMFREGDETAVGLISATSGVVSYGTFTGVHNASILQSDSPSANAITGMPTSSQYHEYPQGTVVSMVSSSYDGSLQPVSFVVSSSAYQDKRAFGVYLGSHNWDDDQRSHAIDKHLIMSVGDGYVLVNNQNGNIETGDYITTASGSGGYGCKQSDDLLHNYTVAKACDSVDWSNESTTYKLLACTYHCG